MGQLAISYTEMVEQVGLTIDTTEFFMAERLKTLDERSRSASQLFPSPSSHCSHGVTLKFMYSPSRCFQLNRQTL